MDVEFELYDNGPGSAENLRSDFFFQGRYMRTITTIRPKIWVMRGLENGPSFAEKVMEKICH